MKSNTIEKLEAKLNVYLAWRRKELIDIKTLIEDDKNSIDKNMLIRSGIALLCAHWEGFIRYAANMYVVYIGDSKIQTKDLKENFLALALKNNIMETGKTEKNSVHSKLMHSIEEMKQKKFYIRYTEDDRIITTNSNLSYDLFNEILLSINIENQYELKKNYIDFNLLKNRHEIVHGEKTYLDKDDFIITFENVMEIMEQFKNQVLYAAEHKLYLKVVN